MYFTALAGVIDERDGRVTYCQAGHPNLIDFDSEFGWRELPDSGYPIGLIEAAEYTSREICLEPGQMLLAVSDGLLRPHADDPVGSQALLQALNGSRPEPHRVIARLADHAAQVHGVERDDQSALLVSRSARQP
jgi:serine phosphatase RsbU (regulator of sigma subunit)